jgi:hypothetical protein
MSKIPTATLWNQMSSLLVTVFIQQRTFVSLCHSLSLMPFECLHDKKKPGVPEQRSSRCVAHHRTVHCGSYSTGGSLPV